MKNEITYKQTKIFTLCGCIILFLVILFTLVANATTPAEELTSINQSLEELDQELKTLFKSKNYYENLVNSDYLVIGEQKGIEGDLIPISEELLQDIAAAYAFNDLHVKKEGEVSLLKTTVSMFQTYHKEYNDRVDSLTRRTEIAKPIAMLHLDTVKQTIKAYQNKVFKLRARKQAILSGQLEPIPLILNECETDKATICGTWTLKDGKYHALWNNGATAVINIASFDDEAVTFTRHDTTGSSKGLLAVYAGTKVSDRRVEGKVTWSWNNNKWSGTWYATW